jgi:hydrocephalus-inducing protein
MYKLEGEALPPEAEKASPITMTVPSKRVHTVRVPVTNWLTTPQKFKVDLEVTSTSEADDKLVLRGLDTMDVPGGKVKDYKMSYQPFKTGATTAKITFTNEETGEYLYYDVQLTAGDAEAVPEIRLEAICRQKLTHTIPVENPFSQEVTLQVQLGACAAWDITHPSTITVAPQKEELLALNLRPLIAGDNDVDVKLSCAELGEYVYKLKLSATAAGPEGGMHFSTDLGGLQPQKFRFRSYRKAPTSYTCSVEDDDFEGDVKVDAPAAEDDDGVEAEVNVTFEPSKLGTTHATMILKSSEGGEYIVNLHGECVPPKPKGPFDVKGSLALPFKNVFSEEKKFSFTVDNPCFTVGPAKKQLHEEVMAGKKDVNLAIAYAAQEGYSAAGKLVASSPDAPNWVFYLNGV